MELLKKDYTVKMAQEKNGTGKYKKNGTGKNKKNGTLNKI